MIAVIAIGVGITVILMLGIPWLLKASVDMEKRDHDHLLDPDTPKIAYLVPDGVDASVVLTALRGAGFYAAVDLVGPDELVLVDAQPGEREDVRGAIASISQQYAAAGLRLDGVTFADER